MSLASCSPRPGTATYADPFQYCAAVGTIDTPDSRYTGPRVPAVIAEGLQKVFGVHGKVPVDPFIRGSSWRCMEGKVYACFVGANLPCLEKADTGRRPSQAMIDFCETNPGDDIPAAVTGRATVYAWGCTLGRPVVVRQLTRPDPRGFLASVWHQIEPATR